MAQLTTSTARALVDAALAKAEDLGVPSSVAVVDASRDLVAFVRQDGARLISVEVSIGKAYTAMSTQLPTQVIGQLTVPGQPLYGLEVSHVKPLVTLPGGFPLEVDGTAIGAIGVSGGTPDDDVAVAQAALDFFATHALAGSPA